MRSKVAFGSVVFILVVWGISVLRAQQPGTVYTGRVSENNYGPLDPRNFPQEDPRQVEPEQLPTVVQGNQTPRCIPPNKKWKLLVQYQDECLYAAPLPKLKKWLYGNNVVIPVSDMQQLGAQAGRCGPDPWDDSKAVCTGGTPNQQPNGAGGKGWRYGPYTYNIPPWNVPAPLKACLSDGTCAPDDPNSTHPHISATPLAAQASAPNCTKGAPGAYDPSANPACEQGNGGPGEEQGNGGPGEQSDSGQPPFKFRAESTQTGGGASTYYYPYPSNQGVPAAAKRPAPLRASANSRGTNPSSSGSGKRTPVPSSTPLQVGGYANYRGYPIHIWLPNNVRVKQAQVWDPQSAVFTTARGYLVRPWSKRQPGLFRITDLWTRRNQQIPVNLDVFLRPYRGGS